MGDHVALTSPFTLGRPMLHANIVMHLRAAPNSTWRQGSLKRFHWTSRQSALDIPRSVKKSKCRG